MNLVKQIDKRLNKVQQSTMTAVIEIVYEIKTNGRYQARIYAGFTTDPRTSKEIEGRGMYGFDLPSTGERIRGMNATYGAGSGDEFHSLDELENDIKERLDVIMNDLQEIAEEQRNQSIPEPKTHRFEL